MSTITVPRPDITSEDVADTLRRGLGRRYNVLLDTGVNWNPVGGPRGGQSDTIVVGVGSNRLMRAQVRLSHDSGKTVLHVNPGGLSLVPRLTNLFGVARKVRRVLQAAPSLR
jgi:hypothetical protein